MAVPSGDSGYSDLAPVEHLVGASNGGLERMSAGPVSAHVALLRGINVGGKNRLPMEDLRAMFTLAGCEAVETYIQSGNGVFKAGDALATRIPTLIVNGIEERFGYRVPVLVRTFDELRDVVRANPFLGTTRSPYTSLSFVRHVKAIRSRSWTPTDHPRTPSEFAAGRFSCAALTVWLGPGSPTTTSIRSWRPPAPYGIGAPF